MQVRKLTEFATIPFRAISAAGLNFISPLNNCHLLLLSFLGFALASAYDVTIPPHGHVLILTDIAVVLPELTYGRIGNLLEDIA